MKDVYGRTSHVLNKQLTVFGNTYPQGSTVKFRPLRVMQLQGEIEMSDGKVVNWNRCTDLNLREEIRQVADALNPPLESV